MNKTRFPIFTAAALALLPMGLSAQTTIAWDATVPTGDFTTDSNWIGGAAPANDLTTNTAQLTGGTVTLDADRSVYGLDTNVASTLTGAGTRLTLGGGGLTGAADLTIGGSAILRTGTVTGATSAITIDGGRVEVTTGTQGFLGTGTITLDNGGTIAGQGSHVNMRNTTSIILGAGGGTLSNANARAFYGLENAVISGAGQLTLDGAGSTAYPSNSRIQLQGGNNTYTGGTLITNKANVQVNGDANFGATSGKVTIDDARMVTDANVTFDAAREFEISANGGRISLNNKAATINGLLSGTGALIIDGQIRDDDGNSPGGSLRLSNAGNTHSGGITIKDVTVLAGTQSAGFLGTGVVTLDNGTIEGGAGNMNMSGLTSIVLESTGGTLKHDAGKALYGLNSIVISGDGQLTLAGPGDSSTGGNNRLQMTGINTYTGGTLLTDNVNAILYDPAGDGNSANDTLGLAGTTVTFDNGRLMSEVSVDYGTRDFAIASGGGRLSLEGNTNTIGGLITGTGDLLIDGWDRNIANEKGGTLNLNSTGTGTLTGAVTVDGVNNINVKGQNALGTGTLSLNNNVQVKNSDSHSTLGNSEVTIEATGVRLMAGWNKSLTLSGVVAGSGDVTIVGDSGTVIWSNAANTFSGIVNLQDADSKFSAASLGAGATVIGDAAATFTFTGDGGFDGTATWTGVTTVADGAIMGGSGSLAGDLVFAVGAKLALDSALSVAGDVTFGAGFGADDIDGLDEFTVAGTYTLIDGTATDFSGLDNFGFENAYALGGDMVAYFQNGSLQLVVEAVPEPSSFALIAGALALGSVMTRRRRS